MPELRHVLVEAELCGGDSRHSVTSGYRRKIHISRLSTTLMMMQVTIGK